MKMEWFRTRLTILKLRIGQLRLRRLKRGTRRILKSLKEHPEMLPKSLTGVAIPELRLLERTRENLRSQTEDVHMALAWMETTLGDKAEALSKTR